MDPSTSRRGPLNTVDQIQQPLVNNQARSHQGISVSQTTRSNPLNPLRILQRPSSYEPHCCLLFFLKWYFYFLGIALYFYIKAGYEICRDQKAVQEIGVLGIDIAFCVYPTIFILIEGYAIIMANKKAALIAVWGFFSYLLLYFIYVLVLYYGVAKDENEKDKVLTAAEFWLAFFIGTTLSGCYCVYSELCNYHKDRILSLERRTEAESYSRA